MQIAKIRFLNPNIAASRRSNTCKWCIFDRDVCGRDSSQSKNAFVKYDVCIIVLNNTHHKILLLDCFTKSLCIHKITFIIFCIFCIFCVFYPEKTVSIADKIIVLLSLLLYPICSHVIRGRISTTKDYNRFSSEMFMQPFDFLSIDSNFLISTTSRPLRVIE